jgi:hypothetical protein
MLTGQRSFGWAKKETTLRQYSGDMSEEMTESPVTIPTGRMGMRGRKLASQLKEKVRNVNSTTLCEKLNLSVMKSCPLDNRLARILDKEKGSKDFAQNRMHMIMRKGQSEQTCPHTTYFRQSHKSPGERCSDSSIFELDD